MGRSFWTFLKRFYSKKSLYQDSSQQDIWGKVFKKDPSKICGRRPLNDLKRYGLPKAKIRVLRY